MGRRNRGGKGKTCIIETPMDVIVRKSPFQGHADTRDSRACHTSVLSPQTCLYDGLRGAQALKGPVLPSSSKSIKPGLGGNSGVGSSSSLSKFLVGVPVDLLPIETVDDAADTLLLVLRGGGGESALREEEADDIWDWAAPEKYAARDGSTDCVGEAEMV